MTSIKTVRLGDQVYIVVFNNHNRVIGLKAYPQNTPISAIVNWLSNYAEKITATY